MNNNQKQTKQKQLIKNFVVKKDKTIRNIIIECNKVDQKKTNMKE